MFMLPRRSGRASVGRLAVWPVKHAHAGVRVLCDVLWIVCVDAGVAATLVTFGEGHMHIEPRPANAGPAPPHPPLRVVRAPPTPRGGGS